MTRRSTRLLVYTAIVLVLGLILGRSAVELYTELLWFGQLGYSDVLWRRILAGAMLRLVTGALGAVVVLVNLGRVVRRLGPVHLRRRYGNLEIAEQIPRAYVTAGIVVASVLAGWWLSGISFPQGGALDALAWLYRRPWGLTEPVLGLDAAFYVFTLPLLGRLLDFLLLVTVWSAVLALVGYVLVGTIRVRGGRVEVEQHPRRHFAVLFIGLLLLFAGRYWLGRYMVLLDGTGFGGSVGYTDVNARLPAFVIMTIACVVVAGVIVYSTVRRRWIPALAATGALVLAGFGLGLAYPSFIQKFRVVPNELAREDPYIRRNLEFTRVAYGLEDIDRSAFAVEAGRVPMPQELSSVTSILPVWDLEPLQTWFNQRESLYGYYNFPSVHFDRYGPPDAEVQVAIAVREFTASGLPPSSRTNWRTLHLNADQVRGNGAVVTPVSEKTADGNPVFWLRSVASPGVEESAPRIERAERAPPELNLEHPAVFFGESPRREDYLILNADSALAETGAAGTDTMMGVRLGSFFRIFAFAWRFGDRNLLFSSELSGRALLFRRGIRERLAAIAPFLAWDPRPYPVISDGRIMWLVDGYTASSTFPIARAYDVPGIGRVRYLNNSVKAVVDGLTGDVTLFALDPDDPILDAFGRAFPGLIRPIDEMAQDLLRHLRYPLLLLEVQADLLEQYHVNSPSAFFSGQNEWQVPQEPAAVGGGRDYAPVYMMAPLQGRTRPEFLLVMPFIARERQNMTAILIVENEASSYGRKTLLELPRDQQISGPRQVRSIIEQDPGISAQLSLWRQGGSDVEIGRLRVVPLDGSILYVQPIFLSGSGNSIPQLQRIIVSDGTSVSMSETLDDAAAGLIGAANVMPAPPSPVEPIEGVAWATRAYDLMQEAERALRQGAWAEFGRYWSELQDLLRQAAADSAR